MSTKLVMGTNGTGRRNRSWPEALKREIVAASYAPGSSVSKVARHYECEPGIWLAEALSRRGGGDIQVCALTAGQLTFAAIARNLIS